MSLTLLDWRRSVQDLYAGVRAEPDPERGWRQWRVGRDLLFAHHPDSPLTDADRQAFRGLRYADYDPALRWDLPVLAAEPGHWRTETGTDGVVGFDRMGRVELPAIGSLDVWWLSGYGGGVFVPLRDTGQGRRSYGGGRYLLDTVKGADLGGSGDRLTIDLNFSYNPSCAYEASWACPLPPPGNVLPVVVGAGELSFP
jgi:uncharacterized protein (DUF1684 family)